MNALFDAYQVFDDVRTSRVGQFPCSGCPGYVTSGSDFAGLDYLRDVMSWALAARDNMTSESPPSAIEQSIAPGNCADSPSGTSALMQSSAHHALLVASLVPADLRGRETRDIAL